MKKRPWGKLVQTFGRSDSHGPFEHLFSLENAGDKHDEKLLKQGLDMLPGVTSVSLSDRGCVAVDYDSTGVRQGADPAEGPGAGLPAEV